MHIPSRVSVAVVAATTLAVMGACTSNSDTDPEPSDSPSSPSATTEPASDDQASVEAAYDAYWEAYIADAADVDSDFAALEAATYYPLRSELVGWVADLHADGQIYSGTPVWTVEEITVDADASPAAATIEACVDISDWVIVEAASGEPVEVPEQAQRYRATATAQQVEGTWYIDTDTSHRDQTC